MIVIPDVHGHLDLLRKVLRAHPEREVTLLGDMIDRGPDSVGVIALARELHAEGRATLIRGNHEDMLIRGVKHTNRDLLNTWMRHGGIEVTAAYAALGGTRFREDIEWLDANLVHWSSADSPEGRLLLSHASRPAPRLIEHAAHARTDPRLSLMDDKHLWAGQQKARTRLAPGYAASVHGHVPQRAPKRENGAYYLDLAPYQTGKLAALDTQTLTITTYA